MTDTWYSAVLADIHDSDYTFLARAAAASAISLLPPAPESGVIVDLGCGSGVTAEILDAVGYSVIGIDASADMISLARERVPTGHFRIESIYDAEIPDCQAVLAVGEIFNYETEDRTPDALAALLRDIGRSLRPDGFLLCDIAGPGRANATAPQNVATGDHWTMQVTATEDTTSSRLTRTINIDVESGWRSQLLDTAPLPTSTHLKEAHVLALIDPTAFEHMLKVGGLAGHQLIGYDGFDFPTGWSAWLARPTR